MRWLFRSAILAVMFGTGCPASEPPPACFTVDTACAPLYQPTSFHEVYVQTVGSMDCGSSRGSCHSASGDSGLSFATEQEAFDNLTARYVKSGDASCSELVVRTSSTGKDYTMPQGSALVEAEQCALRKWVQMGAPR